MCSHLSIYYAESTNKIIIYLFVHSPPSLKAIIGFNEVRWSKEQMKKLISGGLCISCSESPEGLWMTSFFRTWAFLLVLLWRSLSWLHIKLLGDWRPWWHVVIVSIQLFSSHSLPILIDLLLRLHVELRDWSRCWVLGNYFFKNVRNIDSENQALKQGWKYGKKYEKWLNSSGDKKSFYSMFQRNLHF